jgi:hypothetical protein
MPEWESAVDKTIIDLNKANRRRIALWTPWGVVPTDRARLKSDSPAIREKRDLRASAKLDRSGRLAS